MCDKIIPLKQTKNGFLLHCTCCETYHLTFGHFYLELNRKEMEHFKTYLEHLDPLYWENFYCSCSMKRKIPIPTLQLNLHIMLNRSELEELKGLLGISGASAQELIKAENVDYSYSKN
ncbi:MAG: DUF6686 family protein [Bacteroidota bacterium]